MIFFLKETSLDLARFLIYDKMSKRKRLKTPELKTIIKQPYFIAFPGIY